MKNRFFSALVLFLVAASTVSALIRPAIAADQVEFTGSGWGHGVGMSQWGAFGMALDGASSTEILTHYYSGSSIGTISTDTVSSWLVNESKPLWVGLVQSRSYISFKPSGSGATLCLETSSGQDCIPEAAQDGADWRFRSTGSQCVFEEKIGGVWTSQGPTGTCSASVTPQAGSGGVRLSSNGITYRWGVLQLRPSSLSGSTALHGIWQIDIEEYIRGINEVPDSWPTAALRSQVIAARSYALARAGWRGAESSFSTARRASCWCNLYASTNDQVFKGWTAESQNTRFVAEANSTAGTIVLSQGRVAEAVYSSSSGGKTERNSDYWGGVQLPFLQSVDDSASQIPQNPNASWTTSISPATIALKVGLDSLTSAEVTQRFESGSVKEAKFTGLVGTQTTSVVVSGNWVRRNLGLKSRYFSVSYGTTSTTTTTTTTTPSVTTTTVDNGSTTTTEASTTTTPTTTTTTPSVTTTSTTTPTVVTLPPPVDPGVGGGGPLTNRPPPPKGTDAPLTDTEETQTPLDWRIRLGDEEAALPYVLGIDFDRKPPVPTTVTPATAPPPKPPPTTAKAQALVAAEEPPVDVLSAAGPDPILFRTPWSATLSLRQLGQLVAGAYLSLTTLALGFRLLFKLRSR